MILGIDIGGSKTLVGLFDSQGALQQQKRLPTSTSYSHFLSQLQTSLAEFKTDGIQACCVAVPGLIDRVAGLVLELGNLGWHRKPIAKDISQLLDGLPVILENDSKLAGLAEAQQLPGFNRLLYITISTGIGAALLVDGHLSRDVIDMEIGKMPLRSTTGDLTSWEDIASGRAFYKKYGLRGEEVTDPATWQTFANDLSEGFLIACSIFQVDAIVFGGGFGQYADHFTSYLNSSLRLLDPIVRRPSSISAAFYKADSAIHGCFLFATDYQLAHEKDN